MLGQSLGGEAHHLSCDVGVLDARIPIRELDSLRLPFALRLCDAASTVDQISKNSVHLGKPCEALNCRILRPFSGDFNSEPPDKSTNHTIRNSQDEFLKRLAPFSNLA
jgi:hypothetical protein